MGAGLPSLGEVIRQEGVKTGKKTVCSVCGCVFKVWCVCACMCG